ncbi:MAG: hypothetical protein WC635_02490 [Bacteriovorax sp.]|jgi:hypothetical protein
MKKNIFMSLILFVHIQSSVYAEDCPPDQTRNPNQKIEDFAAKIAIIAEKSAGDDAKVVVEAGTTYLMAIAYTTNFNENEANGFISKLTPICEKNISNVKLQSLACTRLSGIEGKMAQKKQLAGIGNAKRGYKYLKKALDLDPMNVDAIRGHADTLYQVYNQGFLARKAVEINLGLSLQDEMKMAKAGLEKISDSDTARYRRILEIMQ